MRTTLTTGARLSVPLLGLLLAPALVGCGGGGAEKAAYASGGTWNSQIATDPGNLDPLNEVDQVSALLDSYAYDTLTNIDSHGKPVPQLAAKWAVTPSSVTFTLRKDVTCGDGAKLTASQVAANFNYIKDPANESPLLGTQLPDGDFTVAADDTAGTVTVTESKPYGFLLQSAGGVPIVCAKGTANRGLLAHGTDGTGPYRLVESAAGDHYTFAVRKDYRWGPDGATTAAHGIPSQVVFKVVQSETTAVNLMLSGKLNDLTAVGVDRKRLQGHGYQELAQPGSQLDLFYNQQAGRPGADPAVRKALTQALDLGKLIKVLTENNGRRPTDLEPNEPKPCRDDAVRGALPAHDAAAAKSVLDQAGWHAGSGGVRAKGGQKLGISLLYPSGTPSVDAGMELIATWWKDLGVDVSLKGQDANALQQALLSTGNWDASVFTIGVSLPSQVLGFLSGPTPPDGQNFAGIQNADYQRLSGQALGTAGADGCALWAKAEQALFRGADVVPVSISNVLWFGNKGRYRIGVNGPEPTSLRLLAS